MSQLNNKMDFDELLTLYVQGNLDESQCKYVEELAKVDSKCNKKLQFEQQIANSIKHSAESFQQIAPSFDALKAQIDNNSRNWWNVFFRNNDGQTDWFNPGLVLASFAAICMGVYMLFSQTMNNSLQDEYETLSNGDSSLVFVSGKQYLRIVVATQVNEEQLQGLTEEFNFTIETGPDSLNSYIVSLNKEKSLSKEELVAWRNDPRLELVEPVSIEEPEYY